MNVFVFLTMQPYIPAHCLEAQMQLFLHVSIEENNMAPLYWVFTSSFFAYQIPSFWKNTLTWNGCGTQSQIFTGHKQNYGHLRGSSAPESYASVKYLFTSMVALGLKLRCFLCLTYPAVQELLKVIWGWRRFLGFLRCRQLLPGSVRYIQLLIVTQLHRHYQHCQIRSLAMSPVLTHGLSQHCDLFCQYTESSLKWALLWDI